jgi:PhoD related phosphatase
MAPIKALGRTGMLGGFLNKFDGGVEVLDDLDDHWTARSHKEERNWFINELQELAAEKSVRITILGGDVHLAAVGRFFSNPKLGIPKDEDHRYMPNIISSAIVNTPPPPMMGDILNKRNKIHHLDKETDEDMIPIFTHDVDGKPRNNKRLLPRRNWCSIREYKSGSTPPPTPSSEGTEESYQRPAPPTRRMSLTRTFSLGKRGEGLLRRNSSRRRDAEREEDMIANSRSYPQSADDFHAPRRNDSFQHGDEDNDYFSKDRRSSHQAPRTGVSGSHNLNPGATRTAPAQVQHGLDGASHSRPIEKAHALGQQLDNYSTSNHGQEIDLSGGLDVVLNLEVNQKDPSGITAPYRLVVPVLRYVGDGDDNELALKKKKWFGSWGKDSGEVGPYGVNRSPDGLTNERDGRDDRDDGYDSRERIERPQTQRRTSLSGFFSRGKSFMSNRKDRDEDYSDEGEEYSNHPSSSRDLEDGGYNTYDGSNAVHPGSGLDAGYNTAGGTNPNRKEGLGRNDSIRSNDGVGGGPWRPEKREAPNVLRKPSKSERIKKEFAHLTHGSSVNRHQTESPGEWDRNGWGPSQTRRASTSEKVDAMMSGGNGDRDIRSGGEQQPPLVQRGGAEGGSHKAAGHRGVRDRFAEARERGARREEDRVAEKRRVMSEQTRRPIRGDGDRIADEEDLMNNNGNGVGRYPSKSWRGWKEST